LSGRRHRVCRVGRPCTTEARLTRLELACVRQRDREVVHEPPDRRDGAARAARVRIVMGADLARSFGPSDTSR